MPTSFSTYDLAKYHEGGRPELPTTDADGSVVDVEMPAKGYAPGPLKTIASMERKAKKIMTEPQNSDPEGAENAFHRNHSAVGILTQNGARKVGTQNVCVEFFLMVSSNEFGTKNVRVVITSSPGQVASPTATAPRSP